MKNYFLSVTEIINKIVRPPEQFTLYFSGENSDYARFNYNKIRQCGSIAQQYIDIKLISGCKHAHLTLGLSNNIENDRDSLALAVDKLRQQIICSNEDPYLMINEVPINSEHIYEHNIPPKDYLVNNILSKAHGLDLVGYVIMGPVFKGFASSYGQFNWFEKSSFMIDTSIYYSNDKAIKQIYADTTFDETILAKKFADARHGISMFAKPGYHLKPGCYNVYFSPAALYEILALINWGGFSKKSLATKNSPLLALMNKEKQLSPFFTLKENTKTSLGPSFSKMGFLKDDITIIAEGYLKNTLISPKTSKEYNISHNGADEAETMCAMDMKGGDISTSEVLSLLDDGLYINNLWYLNFSDRQNGCMTGMTRFYSYVIKNGQPIAPFSVMRFDDSIYHILGDNLAYITKERELIVDSATYDERSTSSALLPGIIAKNVRFTL